VEMGYPRPGSTVLAISLTPAVHAQDFIAALDQPDPTVTGPE